MRTVTPPTFLSTTSLIIEPSSLRL
jgi:hypothetical protein